VEIVSVTCARNEAVIEGADDDDEDAALLKKENVSRGIQSVS